MLFSPRNYSLPCYFHLGIIPSRSFPHYIIYSNQTFCNKHVSFIHLLFKFGKYLNKKYVKYSDKDINYINQVKKVINIINISICKTINTRTYIHSSQYTQCSRMLRPTASRKYEVGSCCVKNDGRELFLGGKTTGGNYS